MFSNQSQCSDGLLLDDLTDLQRETNQATTVGGDDKIMKKEIIHANLLLEQTWHILRFINMDCKYNIFTRSGSDYTNYIPVVVSYHPPHPTTLPSYQQ